MVELRKRKPRDEPPAPPPKRKSTVKKVVDKAKAAVTGKPAASAASAPTVGSTISLADFGDTIETNDGTKTSLKALADESKSGVVLFTYPKASTPGCKFGRSPFSWTSASNANLVSFSAPMACSNGY